MRIRLCSFVVIGLQTLEQLVEGCAALLRGGETSTLTAFEEHVCACVHMCVPVHPPEVSAAAAALAEKYIAAQDALVDQAKLEVFLQPLLNVAVAGTPAPPVPAATHTHTHTHAVTHARAAAFKALTQLMLKADAQALEHHVGVAMPAILRVIHQEIAALRQRLRTQSHSRAHGHAQSDSSAQAQATTSSGLPSVGAASGAVAASGAAGVGPLVASPSSAVPPRADTRMQGPVAAAASADPAAAANPQAGFGSGASEHVDAAPLLVAVDETLAAIGSALNPATARFVFQPVIAYFDARVWAPAAVAVHCLRILDPANGTGDRLHLYSDAAASGSVDEADLERALARVLQLVRTTTRGFARRATLTTPACMLLLRHLSRLDDVSARLLSMLRSRLDSPAAATDHIVVPVKPMEGDAWNVDAPPDTTRQAVTILLQAFEPGRSSDSLLPHLSSIGVRAVDRAVDTLRSCLLECVRPLVRECHQPLAPWVHESLGVLLPLVMETPSEPESTGSPLHTACDALLHDLVGKLHLGADVARGLTEVLEWYSDHVVEFIHLHPQFDELVRSAAPDGAASLDARTQLMGNALFTAVSRAAVRLASPGSTTSRIGHARSGSSGVGPDALDSSAGPAGARLSLRRPSLGAAVQRALEVRSQDALPETGPLSTMSRDAAGDPHVLQAAQAELHAARRRLLRVAYQFACQLRVSMAVEVSVPQDGALSPSSMHGAPSPAPHVRGATGYRPRPTAVRISEETETALQAVLCEVDIRLRCIGLGIWHQLLSIPYPAHEVIDGSAAWCAAATVEEVADVPAVFRDVASMSSFTPEHHDQESMSWMFTDARVFGVSGRQQSYVLMPRGALTRLHSALYHIIDDAGTRTAAPSAPADVQRAAGAEVMLAGRCVRSAIRAAGIEGLWRALPLAWAVQSAGLELAAGVCRAEAHSAAGEVALDHSSANADAAASVASSTKPSHGVAASEAPLIRQVTPTMAHPAPILATFGGNVLDVRAQWMLDASTALTRIAASAIGSADLLFYAAAVLAQRCARFSLAHPIFDTDAAGWLTPAIGRGTSSSDQPAGTGSNPEAAREIVLDVEFAVKVAMQAPDLRRGLRQLGLPISLDAGDDHAAPTAEGDLDTAGDSGASTMSAAEDRAVETVLSAAHLRRIREAMTSRAENFSELGVLPRAFRAARSFSEISDDISAALAVPSALSALNALPVSRSPSRRGNAVTVEALVEDLQSSLAAILRINPPLTALLHLLALTQRRTAQPGRRTIMHEGDEGGGVEASLRSYPEGDAALDTVGSGHSSRRDDGLQLVPTMFAREAGDAPVGLDDLLAVIQDVNEETPAATMEAGAAQLEHLDGAAPNALAYARMRTGHIVREDTERPPKLAGAHELETLPVDLRPSLSMRRQHAFLAASLAPIMFNYVTPTAAQAPRLQLPRRQHHTLTTLRMQVDAL